MWLDSTNHIREEAIGYFSNQLKEKNQAVCNQLIENIPNILTREDNERLTCPPSIEEIHDTIKDLNGTSAAGPDGYNGTFYRFCWDIIKNDFFEAVLQFFSGLEFSRSWTSTLIVMLPKVDNPSSFKQMRPISLYNVSNKIVMKILSLRLSLILEKIISLEQGAFVKGRIIQHNILLAQAQAGYG